MEPPPGPAPSPEGAPPGRLRGGDAARLHLTALAGLLLCAGGFAIELYRALHGHTFSWLYVIEWPFFAAFAAYMWWVLFHGYDRRSTRARRGKGDVAEDDADLLAWRRYVEQMEATEHDLRSKDF